MKTKLFTLAFVLQLVVSAVNAQQVPLFSQYLFNGFLVNPAYAGLDGLSAVNITAREQWAGVPGAPKTHLISYQTRLLRNSFVKKSASARRKSMRKYTSGRVGIGGFIFNDRNGLINRTGGQFTYANHLKMYNGAIMSLAVSASVHQFYINRKDINTAYSKDNLLDNTSLNMIIPDMGFGAVYSTKNYYVGFSADQLLQSYLKLGIDNVNDTYKLYRQYNFTGGYRYEIDKLTAVEPSILFKTAQGSTPQLDLTCRYIFQRDFWVGVSARTGWAFILTGGVTYQRYHFGYAFDYGFSNLYKYRNFGTHEFMFAYKFGDNASRLRWLNR
jgi:type IX secretion system PorP/SprF family membrane protein